MAVGLVLVVGFSIKGFAPRWLAPVMVLVLCSLLSECSQN